MIKDIPEIWRYETEQYEPEKKGGWIIHGYDGYVPKMKQVASGWPAEYSSNESRSRYIDEFLERERVLLDRFKIWENPGFRSIAELIHNSSWR
ncbi:hypothetical protein JTB14_009027 [Gonioctena quinquepunctata]|nr:hypothetical protein JTB14_009027 [Gonioctena quinquepunctata]